MTTPEQPPATTAINMHVQGSMMTSNMIAPAVTFNGVQVMNEYGTKLITAPPGRHRVEASAQWMRKYGQAALDVDLAPGQVVDVYYAAPLHQFTTGSMGFVKQKRKGGAAALAIVLGVVVVIVLLVVIAGLLGS